MEWQEVRYRKLSNRNPFINNFTPRFPLRRARCFIGCRRGWGSPSPLPICLKADDVHRRLGEGEFQFALNGFHGSSVAEEVNEGHLAGVGFEGGGAGAGKDPGGGALFTVSVYKGVYPVPAPGPPAAVQDIYNVGVGADCGFWGPVVANESEVVFRLAAVGTVAFQVVPEHPLHAV